jgi:hypothetical protein
MILTAFLLTMETTTTYNWDKGNEGRAGAQVARLCLQKGNKSSRRGRVSSPCYVFYFFIS